MDAAQGSHTRHTPHTCGWCDKYGPLSVPALSTIPVRPHEGFVDAKGSHGYFNVDRLECWQHFAQVRIEAFAKRSGKVPPMVLETANPAFLRALAHYLWAAADAVEAALTTPTP